MYRVLLLGAGKIGSAIAQFLSGTGDYDVCVADADEASLRRLKQSANVSTVQLSASDLTSLRQAMSDRQAVISALSFLAGLAAHCGNPRADPFKSDRPIRVARLYANDRPMPLVSAGNSIFEPRSARRNAA